MALFALGAAVGALSAQPLHAPQANIGRRKWYLNFGGDVQKIQTLVKEDKLQEAIRETEITLVCNTKPRYRCLSRTLPKPTGGVPLDLERYKMHTFYFLVIGRRLLTHNVKVDSLRSGFVTEFGVRSAVSGQKNSGLTLGWAFSANRQRIGRNTNFFNGYRIRQGRLFTELNYSLASQMDTLKSIRSVVHVPQMSLGGQFLSTMGGRMTSDRDRVFAEMGFGFFARTALVVQTVAENPNLGERAQVLFVGGGARAHFMLDLPAAKIEAVLGVKTSVALGAYAELVSLFMVETSQPADFIKIVGIGQRSLHFQWGVILNLPIYGSHVRHYNRPKGYESDYSPGTLR
ncbi:MAG: hypothetical protein RMM53_00125 [Bacteroidia bacterium]|nr:hypothetical protein [Bacteroidia bacterium]